MSLNTFLPGILIPLLLPSLLAIADDSSPSSRWLKDRLKQGLTLSLSSDPISPSKAVSELKSDRGTSLGSTTKVCLNHPSQKSWYLTNAHVIDSVKQVLLGDNTRLKLEFTDSTMDIALFSGPPTNTPCLELASSLSITRASDIEAAANTALVRVNLEALNSNNGIVEHRKLVTPLVSSRTYGLPGREGTGPLLMINAQGLPGVSGGAITSSIDIDGRPEIAIPSHGMSNRYPIDSKRKEALVGLINAVDPDARQMTAIPAPLIRERIDLFFSDPKTHGSRVTEKSAPGGTRYLDSGAIHYRSSGQIDSGTGKPSDGGTGKPGDGGTGKPGDGGAQLEQGPRFSTGVILPKHPGRRWLSLMTSWTEMDPLYPSVRKLLHAPDRLEGIYEEGGKLQATSSSYALPPWLSIPDAVLHDDPDRQDLSRNEKLKLMSKLEPIPPCVGTTATRRRKNTEVHHGSVVFICEWETSSGRNLFMAIVDPNGAFSPRSVSIALEKNCVASAKPCELQLQAFESPVPASFPKDSPDTWVQWAWNQAQTPSQEKRSPLSFDGLRQFRSKDIQLQLERNSGYRIQIKSSGSEYVLTGPVGEGFSALEPSLLSTGDAHRLVRLMENAFSEIENSLKSPDSPCN